MFNDYMISDNGRAHGFASGLTRILKRMSKDLMCANGQLLLKPSLAILMPHAPVKSEQKLFLEKINNGRSILTS